MAVGSVDAQEGLDRSPKCMTTSFLNGGRMKTAVVGR